MSLVLGKLYIALKSAGVTGAEAEAAAEVAGHENRWVKIESDRAVFKWMLGFNLATTTVILFKVFS